MLYFIVGGIALALLAFSWMAQRKRVRGIPSVPGGLPFIGHVANLMAGSAWDKFAEWVPKHGRAFSVRIFNSEMACIADPDMLKVILQTKLNSFVKDREWTYYPFLVLLGDGLVTSHGANWLRQRTVMATHLKQGLLENVPRTALKAVRRFVSKLDDFNARGEVPELAGEFRHLTLQVIAELLLSLSPQESDETFAKMYLPIVEEGNLRVWQPWRQYLPLPSWFQFRRDVQRLDDYVTSLMDARRTLRAAETKSGDNSRTRDVLDIMLDAVDRSSQPWDAQTQRQCRDELKTFVLAGHETSASMLAWAVYELSLPENKDMLQRVLAEAEAVFGERDLQKDMPTRAELDAGLLYTECCLKESLRKYSVVPTVVRVASEEVRLSPEVVVPKGATLMVSMQGVHHNADFWPQPLQYRPDRFLQPLQPYTFLPFVEGPRMCLGQFLSLLESKIVLALLLRTFSFEVTNPASAGDRHEFMIPIIPKTGHFMRPVRRESQKKNQL